jgi:hypothetical protein
MLSERQALAILLGISLLFAALSAFAGSVTFADVCSGARFVQAKNDLQIYCPGQALPWMTYKGCPKARVLKTSNGNVRVTCGG